MAAKEASVSNSASAGGKRRIWQIPYSGLAGFSGSLNSNPKGYLKQCF